MPFDKPKCKQNLLKLLHPLFSLHFMPKVLTLGTIGSVQPTHNSMITRLQIRTWGKDVEFVFDKSSLILLYYEVNFLKD